MTLETLFEQYAVDRDHARHVADLALVLFDTLGDVHGLAPETRRLLELGALLHNVGLTSDPQLHHTVGRDIVLNADLEALTSEERAIVACLVAFHRKKARPDEEPTYIGLKKKDQAVALRLAALLRVADGLDYSGSQTTRIHACESGKEQVLLHLSGSVAAEDGARAVKKADLWRKVFGQQLLFGQIPLEGEGETDQVEQPSPNGVEHPVADQGEEPLPQAPGTGVTPLAEVGRGMLRRHFHKLLAQERGVREDKDIEAVHQLRVATRRLRAVLAGLSVVAPPKQVRAHRKALSRLARSSSAVRDCDVFLAQVEQYAAGLPEEQRSGLEPLIAALRRDRAVARTALLKQLASKRYDDFKRAFALFMSSTLEEWNRTLRVRDVAGSTIWQTYEALRAHEVTLDFQQGAANVAVALHDARISGKRFRYLLEMFAEALGPDASLVIDPLKDLQEHLGALQDVEVATAYVAGLDLTAAERLPLEAYIASREAERDRLLADLPRIWDEVMGEGYRYKLMELIIRL